jgi:hypothetical protein
MNNEMLFAFSVVLSFFGWRITRLLRELIEVSTRKNNRLPYHYLDAARNALGYDTRSAIRI